MSANSEWHQIVSRIMQERGVSRRKAISIATKEHPSEHLNFIRSHNAKHGGKFDMPEAYSQAGHAEKG